MASALPAMPDERFAVLYVDDEEQALKYFRKGMKNDFRTLTAPSIAEAMKIIEQEHATIGVLLTDQRMPGGLGVELLTNVRQQWPGIMRILVTAYSDLESAIAAVNAGSVYKYLTKPVDFPQLREVLRDAMSTFHKQREQAALVHERMESLQRMVTAERVRSMALMASGISHHLRNSMTAMSCFLEEAEAAAPGAAAPAGGDYMGELLSLARAERERLSRIVHDVSQVADAPALRCADEADIADLARRAAEEIASAVDGGRTIAVAVPAGMPRVKLDAAAIVRLLRTIYLRVARLTPAGGTVRILAEAPVPHMNTTGVRVRIVGDGPAWSDDDVATFFTPFTVTMQAPSELGLDLVDAFSTAWGHGGDLLTQQHPPAGPGFELQLPLDPAAVRRPPVAPHVLGGRGAHASVPNAA